MLETPNPKKEDPSSITLLYILVGIFTVFGLIFVLKSGVESNISKAIAVSSLGALGSFFFEFCTRPGAIFGFYLEFLDKYFRDNLKNPFRFLYSPLGGCLFCFNTWLTSFAFLFFYLYIGISGFYYIPTVLISHLILSVLDRLFWRD